MDNIIYLDMNDQSITIYSKDDTILETNDCCKLEFMLLYTKLLNNRN